MSNESISRPSRFKPDVIRRIEEIVFAGWPSWYHRGLVHDLDDPFRGTPTAS